MRIVGLTRAIGGIKCDAEVGLDHLSTTRPAKRSTADLHSWPELGPPRPG
jgi:hypothetical protein